MGIKDMLSDGTLTSMLAGKSYPLYIGFGSVGGIAHVTVPNGEGQVKAATEVSKSLGDMPIDILPNLIEPGILVKQSGAVFLYGIDIVWLGTLLAMAVGFGMAVAKFCMDVSKTRIEKRIALAKLKALNEAQAE